jgi:ComF family protein
VKILRLGPLLDLLFPRFCLACGEDLMRTRHRWICDSCVARIEPVGPAPCPVCAGKLGPGAVVSACPDCERLRPRFDAAIALGRYEGVLKEMITRMKYGRFSSLAWPLGDLLAGTVALRPEATGVDAVVPVPLRFRRRLARGFNQSELIAAGIGRRLGRPVLRRLLRRPGGGPPQAGLSVTRRLTAPRNTMRAGRVRHRRLLVVDDVMTTGSTLSEAARALKEAGAGEVVTAVLARA